MAEHVTPERARIRLLAYLDLNCRAAFEASGLEQATLEAYRVGEDEVARICSVLARSTPPLRPAKALDFAIGADGDLYSVRADIDPSRPSIFVISIEPYPPSTIRRVTRSTSIRPPSRYKYVIGSSTEETVRCLDATMDAAVRMLEGLGEWIEDQIFQAMEAASQRISEAVYDILGILGAEAKAGRVDVALIGRRRGWRVPSINTLSRSLSALRNSMADTHADLLAATFVSTSLPREELLMSRALKAHDAIVVPFREAPYVMSGSYFGIACQLLDGATTNIIHPVFESEGLNVLLIYPKSDDSLQSLINEKTEELSSFVTTNIRSFEKALEFIDVPPTLSDVGRLSVPQLRVYETLDEIEADAREKKDRRNSKPKRWFRGGGTAGDDV
ncbi:hypothetical protein [Actinoplanes sp. NPDC049802]|uniref:hypothetical protein n=1 Tax=Actinoplanes sp. NPDC049802 TaxID=3154742 RepID=UPI0033E58F1B